MGAPNAFSRSPVAVNAINIEDEEESSTYKEIRQSFFCSIRCYDSESSPDFKVDVSENGIASIQIGASCITWEMAADVLHHDKEYSELARWIAAGCRDSITTLNAVSWGKENLRTIDVNGDGAVIPISLKESILKILHSAHQGVLLTWTVGRSRLYKKFM